MTYRFKLQEPIGQGVRRVGLEQIEIAEAKLSSKDDISAAIHDARRCLKRVRALLRLIRPGLEESVYRREAERLAGIGKLLSGVRDLEVMRQTLGKLESRFDACRLVRRSGWPSSWRTVTASVAALARWPAAGVVAPGAIEEIFHRQNHRRNRARPRHRRRGRYLPQGAQGVSAGVPETERRVLPHLAQAGAAALAPYSAPVAGLAGGNGRARQRG
jgi:hypothetical protein